MYFKNCQVKKIEFTVITNRIERVNQHANMNSLFLKELSIQLFNLNCNQ